ncbi:D-2-hydroxyacid dehydrogenase [Halobacillus salinarum]|uniref:D-2-hydroxyacid dehydrogenase n=1 Tax=Halobacillus salinarum TaxID=2932257 RepID=A0ABY4EJ39_9BACI|nr:D-2-hydroxyacid dehydrogenase [Halobacillus salinarum]UOQ43649.1 D-2-hydroxyacid dehydrogenase [Halobacillus salinarum]
MKVVSAIKRVPEHIQKRLTDKFSSVEFLFCEGIEEAEHHLPEADVFITYGEDLGSERIKKAERLKWVMVLSAGLDKMPFEIIERKGITVTNVRGIHAEPMAEYALSMLLQASRSAKAMYANQQKHHWGRSLTFNEINHRTMVLIGTGAIAQETARLAQAFHMKTIGISRSGEAKPHFDETHKVDELSDQLPQADFVVAVLPSTEETKYLLNAAHFQLMPEHCIFLNMGRGDLVASDDILLAVREGEISHAVLDVFEQEPLPEDHPFWEEENITITPHISGHSPQYIPRGFDIFEENLERYVQGESQLVNLIDPKRGY